MKHAYLIMAHDQWSLLNKLLELIDDERNDIYLHVDAKSKSFCPELLYKPKYSNLFLTERKKVYWGGTSQIDTEMILFKTASRYGSYRYYHLISGRDLPLKRQDYIHDFFDKNDGSEFLEISLEEPTDQNRINRLNHYHIQFATSNKYLFKVLVHLDKLLDNIQTLFNVSRLKGGKEIIKYGANWCSITNTFVDYIISNEVDIKKKYKYTLCCDEVYKQTLAYNSKNTIFKLKSKPECYKDYLMRDIDWDRGIPYTWTIHEYDELIKSDYLFARKFDQNIDSEIIYKIYETLHN